MPPSPVSVSVVFLQRGKGAKNSIDHVALTSSEEVWRAITGAAEHAAPQRALWAALDANLPDKSSAIKVAVQARCVRLLRFGDATLAAWLRASKAAARGAHVVARRHASELPLRRPRMHAPPAPD